MSSKQCMHIFKIKVHKYILQIKKLKKNAQLKHTSLHVCLYADYMLCVFHFPVATSDLQSSLEEF